MLMVTSDLVSHHKLLLAAAMLGFASLASAASLRDANDALTVEGEIQELSTAHIHQTLDAKISGEDRQRLRRDLDEYSRSVDAAHAQIEERRRVMRQRILERFQEADKDGNGVISREEAMEMIPQVARHFMQFDLNGDGMLTLNELETMQARIAERQHKALDKKDKELQEVGEPAPIHVKDVNATATKRAL
ncbi:EF-hand domain-containing protein [Methylobacillus arboreus]|uniref:EF-hand domain-containing protein n=1 Tax=Methylobacillus arboreus TaxID=755170 RepID=UPI001E5B3F4D|nr:EF-hand domain-containing protein [Methylobacillus arboreus]MCB5191442.1 EF-hand domain-containing protein [Methylobacillus arboreus]